MTDDPQYRRILLKISGEGLMTDTEALDREKLRRLADEIKVVRALGVELCLVVGGGNFFRGAQGALKGFDRVTGDYIGMLATVMNALALAETLEEIGVPARIFTALAIEGVGEVFNRPRALAALSKGAVVIFAAGTGSPFFTTDTCAALRASEMKCDAFFKSTQVDGIYDKDPRKYADAKRYEKVSYEEALAQKLGVMDLTAMSLAESNHLPVVVFKQGSGALKEIVCGRGTFTVMEDMS